jgi:hypothetical protein
MTIAALIEAHRQAVLADEANFTDDCVPMDEAAAEASQAVEIQAFQTLVRAQCNSHEEVQAKLGYILHGSIWPARDARHRPANLSGEGHRSRRRRHGRNLPAVA